MKPKDRVISALNHRPPVDRVPIFLWFHPDTADRLGKLLEIPSAWVGEVIGNDVRQTWVNNNYAMEGIVHDRDGESHVDAWGIRWVRGYSFNQISHYPLARSSPEEIEAYVFPDDQIDRLFEAMDRTAAAQGDYFLGCDVSPCAYEMFWRLRGMETAILELVEMPALASDLIDRCASFAIRLAEEAYQRYALDWLWTGDDVASQTGLMFSPKTWRAIVKPALQRVFAVGKAHNSWVAYHCCGALRPILPDLVEMGMDVLNPVQVNCPGMDIFELKREFGKSISFMGGLDTQYLIPNGSTTDVRRAVRRLLDEVAYDGGYILAASHTIPPETPDENIFALLDEAGVSREEIFDQAAGLRSRLIKNSPSP